MAALDGMVLEAVHLSYGDCSLDYRHRKGMFGVF